MSAKVARQSDLRRIEDQIQTILFRLRQIEAKLNENTADASNVEEVEPEKFEPEPIIEKAEKSISLIDKFMGHYLMPGMNHPGFPNISRFFRGPTPK